jgi:importin subunit alpha-1
MLRSAQAVWALGNIAGDSAESRDLVLTQGALAPLLELLGTDSPKQSMLRNATWTLSNLCRGKPQPAWSVVSPALFILSNLISASTDDEVLADGCWALSYLSDGPTEKIQAVLDTGEQLQGPLSLHTAVVLGSLINSLLSLPLAQESARGSSS